MGKQVIYMGVYAKIFMAGVTTVVNVLKIIVQFKAQKGK